MAGREGAAGGCFSLADCGCWHGHLSSVPSTRRARTARCFRSARPTAMDTAHSSNRRPAMNHAAPPVPAAEPAKRASMRFPNESDEYCRARDALLSGEIEPRKSTSNRQFDAPIGAGYYTCTSLWRNIFGQAQLFIRKTPARNRQEKAAGRERRAQARGPRRRQTCVRQRNRIGIR